MCYNASITTSIIIFLDFLQHWLAIWAAVLCSCNTNHTLFCDKTHHQQKQRNLILHSCHRYCHHSINANVSLRQLLHLSALRETSAPDGLLAAVLFTQTPPVEAVPHQHPPRWPPHGLYITGLRILTHGESADSPFNVLPKGNTIVYTVQRSEWVLCDI